MPAVNESGYLTLQAASAIAKNLRVSISAAGLMTIADETNKSIGSSIQDVANNGNGVVKLWSAPGVHFLTASGGITRGSRVYPDFSGKIIQDQTDDNHPIGIALDEAGQDGDIIRVLSSPHLFFDAGCYLLVNGGSFSTPHNVQYNGNMGSFFSNPFSENLSYSVVPAPQHGILVINTFTGAFAYTPTTDYVGTDSFRFSITGDNCSSNYGLVTITVT